MTSECTLSYAPPSKPRRKSKLAIGALIFSLISCPLITMQTETFIVLFIVPIRFPEPFWQYVLFLSVAIAVVAIVRVYLSRGKVGGIVMAWMALIISGFWFAAVYAILLGIWTGVFHI
jgi:hypothetical protein